MDKKHLVAHLRNAYALLRSIAQESAKVSQDQGRHRRVDKATAALLAIRLVLQKLESEDGVQERLPSP
jgi:hypothetical protein